MRHANKRDGNEAEIVDALLANGFDVLRLQAPAPCDLLVWRPHGVGFVLLEVKHGAGRTTELQDEFFGKTQGLPRAIVRTVEEALEAAKRWG